MLALYSRAPGLPVQLRDVGAYKVLLPASCPLRDPWIVFRTDRHLTALERCFAAIGSSVRVSLKMELHRHDGFFPFVERRPLGATWARDRDPFEPFGSLSP